MSAKNFLGLKYLRKIKKNLFNKFQNFLDPKNFLWFWVQTQNPNPIPTEIQAKMSEGCKLKKNSKF
jgi:hypothetical protein